MGTSTMCQDKPNKENVMLQYISATQDNYQTWDLSNKPIVQKAKTKGA